MQGCSCSNKGVASEGLDDAELLIIGPAPTPPEVEAGQLFTGKRGTILWNALRYLKLDRPDVRIVNVICGVPLGVNNMPTDAQVAACSERFEREIKASKAKVVLVLGSFALRQTMGLKGKIDDLNGYIFYPSDARNVATKIRGEVGTYKTDRKCGACKGTGSTAEAPICPRCDGTAFTSRKGDARMGVIHGSKPPTLPESAKIIVPTLHPETIRLMGFKTITAFSVSVERAVRAMRAGGSIDVVEEDGFELKPYLPPAGVQQVAFDIENDIESGAIHRISFAWREGERLAVWTSPWNMAAKQASIAILGDVKTTKIAHNIMHDVTHLEAHGVHVKGKWYCSMQIGATIEPDLLKGLGRMAPIYVDCRTWKEKSIAEPAKYSALDSKIDLLMAEKQQEVLAELGMGPVVENIMEVYPTLLKMTRVGISVDVPRMQAWTSSLNTKLSEYRSAWVKLAGPVNYLSTKQLAKYFYDELGLPAKFNKFGRISTDEEAIKDLWNGHPKHRDMLSLLLDIRAAQKSLGTYAQVEMGVDKRVHPRYTPAYKDAPEKFGVRSGMPATGRLASNNPNIQNQPKDARLLYIPNQPWMMLVEYDYSQLELRIIAALANDKAMQAALAGDIHAATMAAMGITNRTLAKNVVYGTAYGAGPKKLAKMLQMNGIQVNESEAAAFQTKLFKAFPGWFEYRAFISDQVSRERRLTNAFGRTRPFYGGSADIPKGLDFPPQSNGADIVLSRIPEMDAIAVTFGGNLLTSVHDSFLQEVRKPDVHRAIGLSKEWLQDTFDNIAPGFYVPVDVKVSKHSWGEMEAYVG